MGRVTRTGQAATRPTATVWDSTFLSVWHLGEASGNFKDSTANGNTGTAQGTVTQGIAGLAGGGVQLDGSSGYVSTATEYTGPNVFTVSVWFKTTTASGGKLMGFGNTQTGASANYDRHLYLNNSGQVYAGVYPGSLQTINTTGSASDGQWHQAAATLSGNGLVLYVDGMPVGTNSATSAQSYSGWWRLGYDTLSGWPGNPSSAYFQGMLEEARVGSVARSANWIWAEWMTMASNTVFSTYSMTTADGIPYTWLTDHGITNTSNSVETNVLFGDQLDVLGEYIAGLNPTNPASSFYVYLTNSGGNVVAWVPSIAATGTDYSGKTRYYDLESATDLLVGGWQPIPGYTGLLGNGSVIVYTNAPQNGVMFYRARTRLQTP